ncbi:MAG TPA: alpha-amylase family glycosyl hydrolase [Candidatus Krumholzibacteria bacterium]|nr:alpha-amylase family glycosyl hydrolase [Candidatus Krumholzibacteria bacterium]
MIGPPDQDPRWLARASDSSLRRLLPGLKRTFEAEADPAEWDHFEARLREHFMRFFSRFHALYGHQYDFFYHLGEVVHAATAMWHQRPDELKALDALREVDPGWYASRRMVGAMCYVDLFAGDLQGIRDRIPYLKELGITYLHLMPVFDVPEGDNDGGYAVRSFREVRPDLGTMDDLTELATELRHHGISLVLDFVLNHTSDEHEWARRALRGEEEYQDYYRMFDDRTLPDAYEGSMSEIFPDDHPGSFIYRNRIKKWVWTTFNNYQWDLNYENPEVFSRMAQEMLFLANQGVEILRFDALAFVWKRLGTTCQNLPEAHWVIQAFNALVRIVAPAVEFKSEAIVHPDEVRKYVDRDECPLSYNPELMALLWEALATRDVRVLNHAVRRRYDVPEDCVWVNFLRCHDDIGWAFSNEDVEAVGFDPDAHRRFLTDFYTGRFPGSFARGEPFMENPLTGDARVSGMLASLCGLEKALDEDDAHEVELAVRRVLLLHGIVITLGGLPLIYLGDEIGMPNDHSYHRDPQKIGDSRWLHRPRFDWDRAERRRDADTPEGAIYQGLLRLVQLRQQNPAFTRNGDTEFLETGNRHVFGFLRDYEDHGVLVLGNFSEHEQAVEARRLRQMGMRKTMVDLYAGRSITATEKLVLEPYECMVLSRVG